MGKAGRPTKFNEKLARRILELAKKGATEEQIAQSVGIAVSTLNNWKGKCKGFVEALNSSKNVADALVEASLFARAVGYSHPAVKFFFDKEVGVSSQEYTEHYPPDTTACIFWLKNRQKKRWRDSQEFRITKEQAIKVLENELNKEGVVDPAEGEGDNSKRQR